MTTFLESRRYCYWTVYTIYIRANLAEDRPVSNVCSQCCSSSVNDVFYAFKVTPMSIYFLCQGYHAIRRNPKTIVFSMCLIQVPNRGHNKLYTCNLVSAQIDFVYNDIRSLWWIADRSNWYTNVCILIEYINLDICLLIENSWNDRIGFWLG